MDYDKLTIRCSALSKIMGARGLGITGEKYLTELYIKHKYGRSRDLVNKYTDKGLQVEEDSLTLVSRIHKKMYIKNETTYRNEYLSGTPDVVGDAIHDVKSSWDMITFFHTNQKSAMADYEWQLQGYMDLTGKNKAFLHFCLNNTPIPLIEKEKRYKAYEMGCTVEQPTIECQHAWEEIERLCVYDDVPINERVRTFVVNRDDDKIDEIHNRVLLAREWLKGNF
jgi:hypothetical protein